jgi:hypothetical protein
MSEPPYRPRPAWVRIALGRTLTRRAAFSQIAALGLICLLALCVAGLESASDSLLGRMAFSVALAAAVLNLILALWVGLAVCWVDRNGRWTQPDGHGAG